MARPEATATRSASPQTPLAPSPSSVAAGAAGATGAPARPAAALPRSAWVRLGRWAGPLALAVPAGQLLALLWVIWTRTPTAPWWDEWDSVLLVKHFSAGTLTFNDFWYLHWHTHRIVIPRLIELTLIELTRWNRQVQMTFNLALAVGSAILLVACVRLTLQPAPAASAPAAATASSAPRPAALRPARGPRARWGWALVVPLSLLLFSFAQYGDWFAPFQLAFIATVFGVALCLRALVGREPVGWGKWGLAVGGALFATLSSAAGLSVWVAFLPSVARSGRRRLVLWVGLAVVVWAVYLYNFEHFFPQPALWTLPPYTLAYLGAPVAYPHPVGSLIAGLLGVVLLAANIATYWRLHGNLRAILGWIELALFVLATAALTAEGRAQIHFLLGAITSRYQLFPALFWVVQLVLATVVGRDLVRWVRHVRVMRGVRQVGVPGGAKGLLASSSLLGANVIAVVALTAGCVLANYAGWREGLAWQDNLRQNQWCITHYESATDSCLALWFSPQVKQLNLSRAAYLKQHRLANFYYDQP